MPYWDPSVWSTDGPVFGVVVGPVFMSHGMSSLRPASCQPHMPFSKLQVAGAGQALVILLTSSMAMTVASENDSILPSNSTCWSDFHRC